MEYGEGVNPIINPENIKIYGARPIMYHLGQKIPITVVEDRSDFDRALESAYEKALHVFDIDESGHINRVLMAERSSHALNVRFDKCTKVGSMAGQSYQYEYSAWVE